LRLKRVFETMPVEPRPPEQSMSVRSHLHRFMRKFVFDALPGVLASLVGAMIFAQHWSQPALRADSQRLALRSEEITRMILEEHDLMVEFLKREQARDAARQPLTIAEMKAREAAPVSARRAAEPVREARSALPAAAPAALPPASVPPSAKPEPDVVAVESGPLVAPEPQPEGPLARVIAWADRAVDATGLRQVPALVRTIKSGADAIGNEFETISDARFVGAQR
jgi:hypothetical protein